MKEMSESDCHLRGVSFMIILPESQSNSIFLTINFDIDVYCE